MNRKGWNSITKSCTFQWRTRKHYCLISRHLWKFTA